MSENSPFQIFVNLFYFYATKFYYIFLYYLMQLTKFMLHLSEPLNKPKKLEIICNI